MWTAALSATVALVAPGIAHGGEGPAGAARRSAHVVVAVIETGANPYHDEFSRPQLTGHPSTYLPSYPADAEPLDLTLDEVDYDTALEADADEWAAVEPGQLYYVPGTNFAGLVFLPGHPLDGPISVPPEEQRPFLSNPVHGAG